MSKLAAVLIVIVSTSMLVPGIFLPVMSLSNTTEIDAKIKSFSIESDKKERSIMGTVQDLYKSDRNIVATAILTFSVIIPFFKIILILLSVFASSPQVQQTMRTIQQLISKWSMADVFIVAITLVYLSTNQAGSTKEFEVTMLGMVLPVKVTSLIISELGKGFYFFLAYCLISNASLHFYRKSKPL